MKGDAEKGDYWPFVEAMIEADIGSIAELALRYSIIFSCAALMTVHTEQAIIAIWLGGFLLVNGYYSYCLWVIKPPVGRHTYIKLNIMLMTSVALYSSCAVYLFMQGTPTFLTIAIAAVVAQAMFNLSRHRHGSVSAVFDVAAVGITGLFFGLHSLSEFDLSPSAVLIIVVSTIGVCSYSLIAQYRNIQIHQRLMRARDEAQRANRGKSEFIANMSHEMRTPLNGVLGLLAVLRMSDLKPEQRRNVVVAQEAGNALLELIEDVLDISSTELGAMPLDVAPFDPHTLGRNVVDSLAVPANRKGLALDLRLARNLPDQALGDRRRVAQVMRNLVGNAIKYTREGTVTLALDRDQDTLLVTVSDTGIGVPDAQKSKIFERFYQSETARQRSGEGVGIGLSIVKELVELWHGNVSVEDNPSGGTRFIFTLPGAFSS